MVVDGTIGPARWTACAAAVERLPVDGVETNLEWLTSVAAPPAVRGRPAHDRDAGRGRVVPAPPSSCEDAGPATSVQDLPGRLGLWSVGVPPSGPMDDRSFRLANLAAGNDRGAPGLEMTQRGADAAVPGTHDRLALAGAEMGRLARRRAGAVVERRRGGGRRRCCASERWPGPGAAPTWPSQAGSTCPSTSGSRATFALGGFGGHGGRLLQAGDVLRAGPDRRRRDAPVPAGGSSRADPDVGGGGALGTRTAPPSSSPRTGWPTSSPPSGRCTTTPTAPGCGCSGPRRGGRGGTAARPGCTRRTSTTPRTRSGTVDLTGDMPIVLGPDGPSCGGFVCPFTVATERAVEARPARRRRHRAVRAASRPSTAARRGAGHRIDPTPDRRAGGAERRPRRRRAGDGPARLRHPPRRRPQRARRVRAQRARPRPPAAGCGDVRPPRRRTPSPGSGS